MNKLSFSSTCSATGRSNFAEQDAARKLVNECLLLTTLPDDVALGVAERGPHPAEKGWGDGGGLAQHIRGVSLHEHACNR